MTLATQFRRAARFASIILLACLGFDFAAPAAVVFAHGNEASCCCKDKRACSCRRDRSPGWRASSGCCANCGAAKAAPLRRDARAPAQAAAIAAPQAGANLLLPFQYRIFQAEDLSRYQRPPPPVSSSSAEFRNEPGGRENAVFIDL